MAFIENWMGIPHSPQASQASLRDVLISLTVKVALNYVEMRAYQTRLAVAKANLRARNESAVTTYLITLYKALGGEWTEKESCQLSEKARWLPPKSCIQLS